MTPRTILLFASFAAFASCAVALSEDPKELKASVAIPTERTLPEAAVELAPSDHATPNPCALPDVTVVSSRPVWTAAAATIQCGVVQTDSGFLIQSVGAGVGQWLVPSTVGYGLTSRLQIKWLLPTHIAQSGGASLPLNGITDQYLGSFYRFLEQGKLKPALALGYALKIPSANPAKGFGTGFVDHQLIFIASRDFGPRTHIDFNTVGFLAGSPQGNNGAAQFGAAISRAITPKLALALDSFGGSQPGTPNRYGAELLGATWSYRTWLVLDLAYARAYTAGTPRQLFTVGFTHAMRPGLRPIPGQSRWAHFLGR